MNLFTPGERRLPVPPPEPQAGSRSGRWLKVLLATIVVPVLVGVVSNLLKPFVFPPEAPPKHGPSSPQRPTPETLLQEQERLERDIDRLLDRLGAALPTKKAIDRVRQLRTVLGDARLLQDLPDWLQEGEPPSSLPPALETERLALLRRWTLLQERVTQLPSPPTGS